MPTSRLQAGEPADPPSPARPRAEAEYVRAPTRTGHRRRRHAAGPSTSPTSGRRRAAPRRVAPDGAPLGAPAGGRFDRLTRLARQVLRVPAALVWLPDAERRLFFAAQVPSEPWARLREAAPSHAFCRAVVEAGLPLAVADAREDARLRGNPAVEGLGVVACLAVPLALPDGRGVGALCAVDRVPRAWTAEEEAALADLAGLAACGTAAGPRPRGPEAAAAPEAARERPGRFAGELEQAPVALEDPTREELGVALEEPQATSEELAEANDRLARSDERLEREMAERTAALSARAAELEAANAGLREGEARQRALIEALGVAVYTTDAAGRLTFYNDAAAALWGWRPRLGDARWCGSWRLFWPEGRPMRHDECPMAVALREGRPIRGVEAVAERPDGARVPFIPYPTPLRDGAAGAPIGAVNVLVDIGERKAAEAALAASEARYRALFEVSPQMVWFADAEGRCTHVNRHYADFVGLPAERALGDGWLAAVHPEDHARARAAWAGAVAGGGDYEVEYRIRRGSDGSHRWFLVRGAPLRGADGQVERWIGVGIDIDDRRRAEEALRRRSRKLELLSGAAAGLLSAGDPDEVLRPLFRSLAEEFGLDVAFSFVADEGGGGLRLASCFGVPEEAKAGLAQARLRPGGLRHGRADAPGHVRRRRPGLGRPEAAAGQGPRRPRLRLLPAARGRGAAARHAVLRLPRARPPLRRGPRLPRLHRPLRGRGAGAPGRRGGPARRRGAAAPHRRGRARLRHLHHRPAGPDRRLDARGGRGVRLDRGGGGRAPGRHALHARGPRGRPPRAGSRGRPPGGRRAERALAPAQGRRARVHRGQRPGAARARRGRPGLPQDRPGRDGAQARGGGAAGERGAVPPRRGHRHRRRALLRPRRAHDGRERRLRAHERLQPRRARGHRGLGSPDAARVHGGDRARGGGARRTRRDRALREGAHPQGRLALVGPLRPHAAQRQRARLPVRRVHRGHHGAQARRGGAARERGAAARAPGRAAARLAPQRGRARWRRRWRTS